jgi:hypothetical protein
MSTIFACQKCSIRVRLSNGATVTRCPRCNGVLRPRPLRLVEQLAVGPEEPETTARDDRPVRGPEKAPPSASEGRPRTGASCLESAVVAVTLLSSVLALLVGAVTVAMGMQTKDGILCLYGVAILVGASWSLLAVLVAMAVFRCVDLLRAILRTSRCTAAELSRMSDHAA